MGHSTDRQEMLAGGKRQCHVSLEERWEKAGYSKDGSGAGMDPLCWIP